ncbi:MAG: bifunctional nuclease family protein [Bacteroidales bacterium]|nr:bifunctional nuclease family protein [Bacteroidales bacterium]
MEKIPLTVVNIANKTNIENAYTLILAEKNGNRKLPIVIGFSEAQAIAIELDGFTPARPLVYDFIHKFSLAFDIEILEVVITNVEKGIFYAEVLCKTPNLPEDEIIRIDARTSDAVAIALKFHCPIYAYEVVMNKAGWASDDTEVFVRDSKPNLEVMTLKELNEILEKAVEKEDYEFASVVRDEIISRKK